MCLEYQFNLIQGLTSGQLAEYKMLTLRKTGHSHAIVAVVLRNCIVEDPTRKEFHDLREDKLARVHNLELFVAQS